NEIAKEMQTKKIDNEGRILEEKFDICKSNSNVSAFPLLCGWAPKHNQKYGKKGSGKRIAPQVIVLLERFFLDGNVHKNRRMNGHNMRDKLVEKQENGELARDIEIPEVTSINNWIARFATKSKKDLSEQAIAGEVISSWYGGFSTTLYFTEYKKMNR
ncbi:15130_t:CDS:2, partial [Rhizophagus irregularis]